MQLAEEINAGRWSQMTDKPTQQATKMSADTCTIPEENEGKEGEDEDDQQDKNSNASLHFERMGREFAEVMKETAAKQSIYKCEDEKGVSEIDEKQVDR